MKKFTIILTTLALLIVSNLMYSTADVHANSNIEVIVNGKKVRFTDATPYIKKNVVLVPLRFVSDQLKASLSLQDKNITITKNGKTIKLVIGASTALVNNVNISLGVPSDLDKNRVMVPLRFISEAFGEKVRWDQTKKQVWIGESTIPTLDDIKEININNFSNLFGKSNDLFKDRKEATVFSKNNLPLEFKDKYDNVIIYRIWTDEYKGLPVIKIHTSGVGLGIYYLTGDGVPRIRYFLKDIRQKFSDGSVIDSYYLKSEDDLYTGGIKNWENLKITDIKYIGFMVRLETLPLLEYK